MSKIESIIFRLPVPNRFKSSWLNLQQETEVFFDSTPSSGNFSSSWLPAIECIDFLLPNLEGNRNKIINVLDVGCGGLSEPNYHKHLRENLNVNIYGIDPYIGKSNFLFDFAQSVAESIPFENEFFDLILVISALDHAVYPKQALSEMARVCKEGGLIVFCETIRDRNRLYFKWVLKSFFGLFPSRYNQFHNWAWTSRSLFTIISKYFFIENTMRSKSEPSELFVLAKNSHRAFQ